MFKSNSYKKIFLIALFVISIVNTIITGSLYYFYIQKEKEHLYNNYYSIAQNDFEKTEIYINQKFKYYTDAINTIEATKTFQDYIKNNKNKEFVTNDMFMFTKSLENIFQFRYIDENGQEQIRIEKDNSGKVIKSNDLQNKKHRYYYEKTASLNKNQYYISDLDLNIEHNKIVLPYKPTIRIAKPIYINESFKGIVVINYSANEIVNMIRNLEYFDLFYIDNNKNFLLHPDKSKNFSSQLKTNYKVSDEIANFDKLVSNSNYQKDIYLKKFDLTDKSFYILYKLKPYIYDREYSKILNNTLLTFFIVFIITLPIVLFGIHVFSSYIIILDRMIQNIPFPIFFKNEKNKLIFVNHSLVELVEAKNENELIGKTLESISLNKFKIVENEIEENEMKSKVVKFISKKDKVYYFDIRIIQLKLFGIFNKNYTLGIAVDITAHKQLNNQLKELVEQGVEKRMELEEALIQNSKMAEIGNMLGNIIHQWKQPLNIISIEASNLAFQVPIDSISKDDLEKGLNDIVQQIKFMDETTNSFKDFFNPQEDKKNFLIFQTIEKIEKILSHRIEKININFQKNLDENLYINGYENDLGQVILSIINNALDEFNYSEVENKILAVNLFKENDNIALEIKDNARQIPDNLLPNKIFEKYFTTKKDRDGTGLGLTICKTIIESKFKGKIMAYNEEPNIAVFKIVLNMPEEMTPVE